MCSFLVTNKNIDKIDDVNFFIKKRGPDYTNIEKHNKINFIHNLLSITGEVTVQPLCKNDIYLVYNGEIYNYNKHYSNDTRFLLDCYMEYGSKFYNKIDGEYAIVIVDFNKNKIIFSGDIFLTKPIFYSIENNKFGIASYESSLIKLGFTEIHRPLPNHYYELSLDTYKLKTSKIYTFNLNQNVDTFDLWNFSFEEALKKRTNNVHNKIIVPFSSGHDSGSIVCGLNNIKYNNFITYTFLDNENSDVINKRLKFITGEKIIKSKISNTEYKNLRCKIDQEVEKFYYGYNYETRNKNGFDDDAAVGLYKILSDIKNTGVRVLLSGQGGDEIYSNNQEYGFANKFNPRVFPKNLRNIFPWANFYYGGNYSYLTKEEYIAGSLGIETRYPLLDRDVIQQFLNLTCELKNKFYKAPLTNYLTTYNFPLFIGKAGFKLNRYKTNYLNKIAKYTDIDILKK